jgi:hypothetical protein
VGVNSGAESRDDSPDERRLWPSSSGARPVPSGTRRPAARRWKLVPPRREAAAPPRRSVHARSVAAKPIGRRRRRVATTRALRQLTTEPRCPISTMGGVPLVLPTTGDVVAGRPTCGGAPTSLLSQATTRCPVGGQTPSEPASAQSSRSTARSMARRSSRWNASTCRPIIWPHARLLGARRTLSGGDGRFPSFDLKAYFREAALPAWGGAAPSCVAVF